MKKTHLGHDLSSDFSSIDVKSRKFHLKSPQAYKTNIS